MSRQTLVRCMATISLALAMLAGFVLASGRVLEAQAHTDAGARARITAGTDWTVGGPCGATIQTCINNPIVTGGDRILIPAGRYTESLTLDKAVSLIGADANSTVVHAVSGQRVLTITGSAITATTVISGLMLTGGHASAPNWLDALGGGILIAGTAQPIIRDVIVWDNRADFRGGGIYGQQGSPMTLTNMSVISNFSPYGGGAYTADAAVWIGSHFERNDEGGLHAGGPAVISACTFVSNTGTGGGGLRASSAVTIIASRFEGNTSESGGGLHVSGELLLIDTAVISNTATSGGGGGANLQANATLIDSVFERNTSNNNGGGLLAFESLNLINSDFISNTQLGSGFGGGIYADRPVPVNIDGGRFIGNRSDGKGGGMYSIGVLTITGTQFINNRAVTDSGGLYAGPPLVMTGGLFQGNTAVNGHGGGLHSDSSTAITGTVFLSNSAALKGGAAYLAGFDAHVINAAFAGNQAGAGAAIGFDLIVGRGEFLHLTIADAGVIPSPAIAVFRGELGITNTILASHTVGISVATGTVYEDYNLFFANGIITAGAVTGGGHSFSGSPAFVNPAVGDYHLRFASTAIDRGIDAGVTLDIDGDARPYGRGFDIGADEFVGPRASIFLPLVMKSP